MPDVHGIYIKSDAFYFGHKRLPGDLPIEVTGTGTLEDPYVPVQGEGGGSTPGIDDVLGEEQALTADRTIAISSHNLLYTVNAGNGSFKINNGTNDLLDINSAGKEATIFGSDGTQFSRVHVQGGVHPTVDIIATEGEGTGHYANILLSAQDGLIEYHTWGKHEFLGNVVLMPPTVPATASDIGQAGQLAWDANFFYVCVATDTWKRSAIATW